jgi:hypothetical protein
MILDIIIELSPDSPNSKNQCAGAGFAYGNSREMPFIKPFVVAPIVYELLERSIGPEVLMVHQRIPILFLPDPVFKIRGQHGISS